MKLLQSEQQMLQLKQTIGQHNGPGPGTGLEFVDTTSSANEFSCEWEGLDMCVGGAGWDVWVCI